MDGGERLRQTWKSLKRRLRFTGLACCGSSWSLRVSDMTIREEVAQLQAQAQLEIEEHEQEEHVMAMQRGRLNLAMALAAERDLLSAGPTAQLKTLMRLFEEADGRDENSTTKDDGGGGGGGGGSIGGLCCVCMERTRGAALIPCGHTYCRACSRELWLNKGLCPLCNRSIQEILDIF